MPNFNLKEIELGTGQHSIRLDKWLYFIKHLEDFQTIPAIIADEVFSQAFEKAKLAKFGQKDLYDYEMNLKFYRDYKNTVTTAFDEGKLEGIVEGKIEGKIEGKLETAKSLKEIGVPMETIMAATGLTKAQIDGL
jgi:predicted transposase/invertase (TIGR01784 family)